MNEPIQCGIAAAGAISAPWQDVPALRKKPELAAVATQLKMSDDQAILAAAAMQRAIDSAGWQARAFRDWTVIAGPRFLGRCRIAVGCARFPRHGTLAFSPLLIPHQSLHAVASTLSIAFKINGPSFGCGPGPDHVAEALYVALSTVRSGAAGVWVVISGYDPEPIPTPTGECQAPTTGHALAFALSASVANAPRTLELDPNQAVREAAPINMTDLLEHIAAGDARPWSQVGAGMGRWTIRSNACAAAGLSDHLAGPHLRELAGEVRS